MARQTKQSSGDSQAGGRTIVSQTAVTAHRKGSPASWSPPPLSDEVPDRLLPMKLSLPDSPSRESDASQAPPSSDEPFEQIATRRPELVARVIQAILSEEGDDGLRKVATIVIGLGTNRAPAVLKHCAGHETERIAGAVRDTPAVTARKAQEAFEEAGERLLSGNYHLEGGWGVARSLVYRTLGSEGEARNVLDRLLEADFEEGIEILNEMPPDQAAPYLLKEHPQTVALAMAQMDAAWGAEVLSRFPVELRNEIVDRVRELDTITAGVLYELRSAIEWDTGALRSGRVRRVGGPEVADRLANQLASVNAGTGLSREERPEELHDEA